MNTKTTTPTKKSEIKKAWVHIDAKDQVLGKLAVDVVRILIGKHKTNYAPYLDSGDIVLITNAQHIALTGAKETDKIYYSHSGKVGKLKEETVSKLREHNPSKIIYNAVKGMLPKNRLRKVRLSHLKIFKDENHPHQAQVTSKDK